MDPSKLDEMTRKVMSYSKHMNFKSYSGIAMRQASPSWPAPK